MRDLVEDIFLEWQGDLPKKHRDRVLYDSFEEGQKTVFVVRMKGFDTHLLRDLERELQEGVDPLLLVSSILESEF